MSRSFFWQIFRKDTAEDHPPCISGRILSLLLNTASGIQKSSLGVCRLKDIISCGSLLQPAETRKKKGAPSFIVNFVTTIIFLFFLLYFMEHLNGYAVKHNVASGIPTSITCYTLSFVAARYRPLSVPGTFFYTLQLRTYGSKKASGRTCIFRRLRLRAQPGVT